MIERLRTELTAMELPWAIIQALIGNVVVQNTDYNGACVMGRAIAERLVSSNEYDVHLWAEAKRKAL